MDKTYRINSFIASSGVASRRKADEAIKEGKVKINGTLATLNSRVSEEDIVEYRGKVIKLEEKVYYAFHKPSGYVTSLDDRNNRTILELISVKERLFPIGRLDKDTEGLLLMTNDGDLFNRLMHPSAEVWKEYLVKSDRKVRYEDMKRIEQGIYIKALKYKTAPAKCSKVKGELHISIREGKNRQIRRMLKNLGYEVKYLKRVAIGKIRLGSLAKGEIRALNQSEMMYLKGL